MKLLKDSKLLACMLASALTACGGGGGSPTTATVTNAVVEGVWSGTSSGGYTLNMLALEDSSAYAMFGTVTGTTFSVVGFDQGTIAVSGNSMSGAVREYLYNGTLTTGSMAGTATTGTSIAGSTTPAGGVATTFNLTPIATSTYNYGSAANISDVAGSWTGSLLNGTSASITIASGTGAIAGTNLGCSFTGTATPRASGKNVFNVSLTFGASPCALPGQTATGIAIDYAISGTALKQLLVAVQDSTKANGTMFFAKR
jgi:hypothetical protein